MNNTHINKSHKNKQINVKSIKNNQTNKAKPNHILLRVKEKRKCEKIREANQTAQKVHVIPCK